MRHIYRPRFSPIRLATCVVAGVVLSLAVPVIGLVLLNVATTCAPELTVDSSDSATKKSSARGDMWYLNRIRVFGATQYRSLSRITYDSLLTSLIKRARGAHYSGVQLPVNFRDGLSYTTGFDDFAMVDAGWPFPAFTTAQLSTLDAPSRVLADFGTLQVQMGNQTLRLPNHLHPRGIAANALIWFAIVWLTVQVALLTRSALRIARGLCPHCRYDLCHTPPSSPCPECGTPFSSSRSSAANDKLSTPDASPSR